MNGSDELEEIQLVKDLRTQLAECQREKEATVKTRDHYFVESERNMSTACVLQRERDELRVLLREIDEQPNLWLPAELDLRITAALASERADGEKP